MHELTRLIQADMKVSLGVTEPGAIALAASRARSLAPGEVTRVLLEVNSGIYKNAFTCGIPGTEETGNLFAAALGVTAGDWTKGLASLSVIGPEQLDEARRLIREKKVEVRVHEVSSALFIRVTVETQTDCAQAVIEGRHDQITRLTQNGVVLEEKNGPDGAEAKPPKTAGTAKEEPADSSAVTGYTVSQFWDYIHTVPAEEIGMVREAYRINLALMEEGAENAGAPLCKVFLEQNGGALCSGDCRLTEQAMTAAAIEARVRGFDRPAMSITGSGNHGILCTVPLHAYAKVNGLSEESLLRATALSYLITMYIKEYSGKLSAFCGCAIAAGCGAAAGLLFLSGGSREQLDLVIRNFASSITGMICTGGNPACVMKASTAVDTANWAVKLALENRAVEPQHGICAATPEQTMRNMGLIASPGMEETEKTILEILEEKSRGIQ